MAQATVTTSEDRLGQAEFARRLYKAMNAKNLSASQLAGAVWGTRPAIINGKPYMVSKGKDRMSYYLKGHGYPRPEALEKMAEHLGVAPKALAPQLYGEGAGSRPPPEVQLTLLDGKGSGRAALVVNAVLPVGVALEVTRLIQEARHD